MNKKLLLINPRSENNSINFNFFPTIVLGIIEQLTPKNWDVTIVDENIEDLTDKDYDLVGITSTHNINRAYKIAELYRQKAVPVIMGGMHVSAIPDEAMQYVDSVVVGNVEPLWIKIIHDFEAGSLKKQYINNDNQYNFVEPCLNYFHKKYFAYALETSRGCFNNCSFCGIHIPFQQSYKRKPIEMIINELKKTDNPFVFIIDNNFYGNDENNMFLLFNEMIRQKISKVFFAAVSVGFFNNEKLVALAAKAGLKMVFIGFESDTQETLGELNKKNIRGVTGIFNEYKAIIDLAHKNRILVSGKAIVGLENDTEEIINKRIDFFSKLKLDEFSYSILTPLPGSVLFKKFQAENKLLHTNFPDDWIKYDHCKNSFMHNNLSKEKLEIYASNYAKPGYRQMLRSLIITRSLKGLLLYYAYNYYMTNYKKAFLHFLLKTYTVINGHCFPPTVNKTSLNEA